MNGKTKYRLNGADRFQLFFDSIARKKTGIGNVIRAVVTLGGNISESDFRKNISSNEAIHLLTCFSLKKNWYSALFYFEPKEISPDHERFISFHANEKPEAALEHALARDCNLTTGSPVHIDVIYDQDKTHIVFSVNHSLMDYAGMENLLGSVFANQVVIQRPEEKGPAKSFFVKFRETVEATFFVAARTAWNMRHLSVKSAKCKAAFEKLEFTIAETEKIKQIASSEIMTNALSFYLGSSLFSLSRHNEMLTGEKGIYFIAVPLVRRPAEYKNAVLSNFHSYIYFHARADEIVNVRDISLSFSRQMIMQARRKMPEKFSVLLDLFRFIPAPVYRAFIDLPTNGHAGSFAFSLLPNSRLENKSFGDCPVVDVTHYAPVITPPGLNIVFHEFAGKLKIILSFDESRMTKNQARSFLDSIRKNLIT